MAIDPETVFKRITSRWRVIALDLGQTPPAVPRRDSQVERMALAAVDEVQRAAQFVEGVQKDDIVAWLTVQARRGPRQARRSVQALAEALRDGSWEDQ